MANKPAEKKNAAIKQIPWRASAENWRRVNVAKANAGITFQQLAHEAIDEYLRRRKLGELLPQEDPQ